MRYVEAIFWLCAAGVAYTYVLYPAALKCLARLRARPVRRGNFTGTVSIVLAAHNEAPRVAARRDELLCQLRQAGVRGEVVIASDGSTDCTVAAAGAGAEPGARLTVLDLRENVGKASALTKACEAATGDVLVFADARQHWAPDALRQLLTNFADPSVGGASGDLCLEMQHGTVAGVGLYWRYEKAVRRLESRLHSTVGATGAISAVRRDLFRPIPPRTILDDVYWPMRVAMQGYRVVHDESARAFDRLPDKAADEFRRKVRTLSGNFQLIVRLPSLLLPWRNPLWVQFLSHKLMRLAVPWLLLGMLVTSASLRAPIYRVVLGLQLAGYVLALAGSNGRVAARSRLASAAASFVVLNIAAAVALWVWATGRSGSSWKKVKYDPSPATPARPNDPQADAPDLKSEITNVKSQVPDLKSEISNLKCQHPHTEGRFATP